MDNLDKIIVILKSRKLKKTTARVELLSAMMHYGSAMPFAKMQQKLGATDRITLYRTLKTLVDKGVIHKASFDQDETYYALCASTCAHEAHQHDHIHFKCLKCASVSCIYLDESPQFSVKGLHIQSININAEGVCSACMVTG
jgi:Fur family ferric uptake transcriptional regulator